MRVHITKIDMREPGSQFKNPITYYATFGTVGFEEFDQALREQHGLYTYPEAVKQYPLNGHTITGIHEGQIEGIVKDWKKPMNTKHCPQRALELIAKLFEDKAPEKGDASTCRVDIEDALSTACTIISENKNKYDAKAIHRITVAIGHLMVALQTMTDSVQTLQANLAVLCRVEGKLCSEDCNWISLEDAYVDETTCALFGTEIKNMKRCERCLATFKENK